MNNKNNNEGVFIGNNSRKPIFLDMNRINENNLVLGKAGAGMTYRKVVQQHKCEEIRVFNKNYNDKDERLQGDDYVYIMKDSDTWEIVVSYWNDEYDQFEVTSAPIGFCPYCGEKLI